jgi:phosphatidylglycerophosphate synthase
MNQYFTIPNIVCYFRILLCFYSFYFFLETNNQLVFSILILIIILLDGLDGILARALNQATSFGAKLDIVADRIIELSFWFFFAYLGYIGYWIFSYFLIRGLIVDWISFKSDKPLGDSWLRSSRFMRFLSGLSKIISFVLLASFPASDLTQIIIYLAVLTNLLRALPSLQQVLHQRT